MKYKVGDRVVIKDRERGGFPSEKYYGKSVTISEVKNNEYYGNYYHILEDGGLYWWEDSDIERKVRKYKKRKKSKVANAKVSEQVKQSAGTMKDIEKLDLQYMANSCSSSERLAVVEVKTNELIDRVNWMSNEVGKLGAIVTELQPEHTDDPELDQPKDDWPQEGDRYWTIGFGEDELVYSLGWWPDVTIHENRKKRGLIFRTKEEAIAAAEKMLKVVKEGE